MLTLDEAKAQLQVEHLEDDVLIQGMIDAAEAAVLDEVGLGGVKGRSRTFYTSSQATRIGYPVESLTSVEVGDCTGSTCTWSTIDPEDYSLEAIDDLASCLQFTDEGFVALNGARVKVVYVIGWAEVPKTWLQAARLLVTHFYENRSAVVIGQGIAALELPLGVKSLLAPYRLEHFS